jgi:preprotein translocase subunit SecE
MPAKERLLEVLAVVVLAVVIFAGLFFGIRMLE